MLIRSGVQDKPAFQKEIILQDFLMKSALKASEKGNFLKNISCLGHNASSGKQWRRRCCVLYKVRKPGETEVFFEYFADADCKKFRGFVDLRFCHHIYANTRVDKREHVFSIHTKFKGKNREYHFSAESALVMNRWVKHLSSIVNLVDTTNTIVSPSIMRRHPNSSLPDSTFPRRPPVSPPCQLSSLPSFKVGVPPFSDCTEDVYRMNLDPVETDEYAEIPKTDHPYVNITVPSTSSANFLSSDPLFVSSSVKNVQALDFLRSPPEGIAPWALEYDRNSRSSSHQSVYINVWDLEYQESYQGTVANEGLAESIGLRSPVSKPMSTSDPRLVDVRADLKTHPSFDDTQLSTLLDSSKKIREEPDSSAHIKPSLSNQNLPSPSDDLLEFCDSALPVRTIQGRTGSSSSECSDECYDDDDDEKEGNVYEAEGGKPASLEVALDSNLDFNQSTCPNLRPDDLSDSLAYSNLESSPTAPDLPVSATSNIPTSQDDQSRDSMVVTNSKTLENSHSVPPSDKEVLLSTIQYLDAVNLDFASNGKKLPPVIPPRPPHLRREDGNPRMAEHHQTSFANDAIDNPEERVVYKELDMTGTTMMAFLAKQVLGDDPSP